MGRGICERDIRGWGVGWVGEAAKRGTGEGSKEKDRGGVVELKREGW